MHAVQQSRNQNATPALQHLVDDSVQQSACQEEGARRERDARHPCLWYPYGHCHASLSVNTGIAPAPKSIRWRCRRFEAIFYLSV